MPLPSGHRCRGPARLARGRFWLILFALSCGVVLSCGDLQVGRIGAFARGAPLSSDAREIRDLLLDGNRERAGERIRGVGGSGAQEPGFRVVNAWYRLLEFDVIHWQSWSLPWEPGDGTPFPERLREELGSAVEEEPALGPLAADVLLHVVSEQLDTYRKRGYSVARFGERYVIGPIPRVTRARVRGLEPIPDDLLADILLFTTLPPWDTVTDFYGADPRRMNDAQRFERMAPMMGLVMESATARSLNATGPWYEMLWDARRFDPDVGERWGDRMRGIADDFIGREIFFSGIVVGVQADYLDQVPAAQAHSRMLRSVREKLAEGTPDGPDRALVAITLAAEDQPEIYAALYQDRGSELRALVAELLPRVEARNLVVAARYLGWDPRRLVEAPLAEGETEVAEALEAAGPDPASEAALAKPEKVELPGTEPALADAIATGPATGLAESEAAPSVRGVSGPGVVPVPTAPGCNGTPEVCARLEATRVLGPSPCRARTILEPYAAQGSPATRSLYREVTRMCEKSR
jgi:hypothetical protein